MNSKLTFLAIFMIGFAASAFAQSSATATVGATIVGPVSIKKSTDLHLGSIAPGADGGTLAIGTDGALTASGIVTTQGGTIFVASFTISGDADASYYVSLPGSVILTETVGGTATMPVDVFTSNPSGNGSLDNTGNQTVNVGATLSIDAGQRAGVYENTTDLTVTVGYN